MLDGTFPRRSAELVELYRTSGAWGDRSIGAELAATAEKFPEHVAVVDSASSLTYRELVGQASAVASGLRRRGITPGDAAVIQSGNTVETVVAFYGLLMAGAVPVCALPQHREKEISDLIALTGARIHVVQADWHRADLPGLAAIMRERHEHLGITLVVRGRVPGGLAMADLLVEEPCELPAIASTELGILQLSGGTTGTPKLIPRLHCDYVCNARAWAQRGEWDSSTVSMHVLPIMHNAGLVLSLLPTHLAGGTLVLAPRVDGAVMAELIARERVTDMLINATVAFRMLESEEFRAADISSLRRVSVGPQNPEHARRFEEELGIRSLGVFGMGEGLIMVTPWDAPTEMRRTTVGTPIHPLDEVRIVDDDLAEVPHGQLGELTTRGPYTIAGYYNAESHNANVITSDGFFRTGDLARAHQVDGQVFYSIEGRIKDNIDRGGEKINAEEIEWQLSAYPAVASVAVVGMPDPEMGERLCAYIVARPGFPQPDVATIGAYLLEQGFAKFKLPERIEIIDAMPLTAIGKISKKTLREDISSKLRSSAPQENFR